MDINTALHTMAAESEGGLFGALGINGQMLLFQIIGFLVLVWVMKRWVFPVLFKVVDEREEKLHASVKAAEEAEKSARKAQDKIEHMMDDARKDAAEIVATAHDEATAALAAADAKAKSQAKHLVDEAHDEIAKEVVAAKKALHNETIELVALATEKVVGSSLAKSADDTLIEKAIKEAK